MQQTKEEKNRDAPINRPLIITGRHSLIDDWLLVQIKANKKRQSDNAKPDSLINY